MRKISFALLILALSAPAVQAAGNVPLGLRMGYTSWHSINQMHLGAHAKLGELFQNVAFTPNIEVGFGDSATLVTLNGDVAYLFTELVTKPWGLYGGGSLSFNYFDYENADSQTDLGLSALLGTSYEFSNGNEGLVEVRLGIMDSPAFKLTFGYTFF
jgi:hypothetical protein